MMEIRIIKLQGCDDTTYIPIRLSENEIKLLENISELSKKVSRYGCMPIMTVRNEDLEDYDLDRLKDGEVEHEESKKLVEEYLLTKDNG